MADMDRADMDCIQERWMACCHWQRRVVDIIINCSVAEITISPSEVAGGVRLPSMARCASISELVARQILRRKHGNRKVFSASRVPSY